MMKDNWSQTESMEAVAQGAWLHFVQVVAKSAGKGCEKFTTLNA